MQCTSKQIESVTTEYEQCTRTVTYTVSTYRDTAPQHAYKNKRKDLPLVVVES